MSHLGVPFVVGAWPLYSALQAETLNFSFVCLFWTFLELFAHLFVDQCAQFQVCPFLLGCWLVDTVFSFCTFACLIAHLWHYFWNAEDFQIWLHICRLGSSYVVLLLTFDSVLETCKTVAWSHFWHVPLLRTCVKILKHNMTLSPTCSSIS